MRYPAHTMPSADFCAAVRPPYGDLSPVAETQRRPPEVRPTAFAAPPPDLPPRRLMTMDFAIIRSLVRPGRPRYPVLVHRAAVLLHASFRHHLAAMPLRFANPSPSSGWIEDSHLQAVDHARHTQKSRPEAGGPISGTRRLQAPARQMEARGLPLGGCAFHVMALPALLHCLGLAARELRVEVAAALGPALIGGFELRIVGELADDGLDPLIGRMRHRRDEAESLARLEAHGPRTRETPIHGEGKG